MLVSRNALELVLTGSSLFEFRVEQGPISTLSSFLHQLQSLIWVSFILMTFTPTSPLATWSCFHLKVGIRVSVLELSAPKLEQNSQLKLTKDTNYQDTAISTHLKPSFY